MVDTTEKQYLDMANHAKKLLDDKSKYVEYLKDKFEDIDTIARNLEYKTKQMEHLLNFKLFDTSKERKLLEFLLIDLKNMYEFCEEIRCKAQEGTDEEDEEDVMLMLTINDSIESL